MHNALLRRVVTPLLLAVALAPLPTGHADAAATVRVVVEASGGAPAGPDDGGTLGLEPTVQVAGSEAVVWRVANSSPRTLEVDLSLRALGRVGADGAVGAVARLSDVVFEDSRVTLDPGEVATATVPRDHVTDEVLVGLALVASSPTAEFDDLVGMVVAARAAPADVLVDLVRVDGRLRGRVELETERALVVDVRGRLVTWPSRVVTDRTVRDVVVLPPGRAVDLDLAGTAFVGPVDLEVVAGAPEDAARDVARAWIVNRTAVRMLGAVVLLITLAALGAATWRRRPS